LFVCFQQRIAFIPDTGGYSGVKFEVWYTFANELLNISLFEYTTVYCHHTSY